MYRENRCKFCNAVMMISITGKKVSYICVNKHPHNLENYDSDLIHSTQISPSNDLKS